MSHRGLGDEPLEALLLIGLVPAAEAAVRDLIALLQFMLLRHEHAAAREAGIQQTADDLKASGGHFFRGTMCFFHVVCSFHLYAKSIPP